VTAVAEVLVLVGSAVIAYAAARALTGRTRPQDSTVVRRESPTEFYLRRQREEARAWGEVDR